MSASTHIKTTVLPGGKIELVAPGFKAGEAVDVFLLRVRSDAQPRRSFLDLIREYDGPRLFKTPEEADAYLREERDSWER